MLTNDMIFKEALSPSISQYAINDLPILNIQNVHCEAAISLHGGHLFQFKPAGQQEVIWLSNKAIFSEEKAIRGGVPVCWPWFGPASSPSHGFARTSHWQLLDHEENEQGTTVRLELSASQKTRALWPHDFSAILTFTLGSTLRIHLEMINSGETPWQWSGALHTYFNLAEATETRITGMGSAYIDSLQNHQPCDSSETLMVNQSIDRIYTNPVETVYIHDQGHQRVITVQNRGHNSVVIWNPWKELSKTMGDMSDDGYKTMVCVEAAQFAKDLASGTRIMPGEKHQLSTEISVIAAF